MSIDMAYDWAAVKFSALFFKSWTVPLPMVAFLTTDWLTGNTALGVAISALMTAIIAIVTTRPKLIAARAAALVTTTGAQDAHIGSVVARMAEMHQRELFFWKERSEVDQKTKALLRVSKHKALNSYQSAILWIKNYEELMREHNIKFAPYAVESIESMTGDEDRAMTARFL